MFTFADQLFFNTDNDNEYQTNVHLLMSMKLVLEKFATKPILCTNKIKKETTYYTKSLHAIRVLNVISNAH